MIIEDSVSLWSFGVELPSCVGLKHPPFIHKSVKTETFTVKPSLNLLRNLRFEPTWHCT